MNPCLFYSKVEDRGVMVHDDDFVAIGSEKATRKLKKSLKTAYKVKCDVFEGDKDELDEIRFLNRLIRRDDQGLSLEADPRHAEIVVRDLGLENAKPSWLQGGAQALRSRPCWGRDIPPQCDGR